MINVYKPKVSNPKWQSGAPQQRSMEASYKNILESHSKLKANKLAKRATCNVPFEVQNDEKASIFYAKFATKKTWQASFLIYRKIFKMS